MAKTKLPPRTVTYVTYADEVGSVLSRTIQFSYAAQGDVEGYADALHDDWLDKPITDQRAEMDRRYLAWLEARQPAPETDPVDLPQAAADLIRQRGDIDQQLAEVQAQIVEQGGTVVEAPLEPA
jgi:hypothetical protein